MKKALNTLLFGLFVFLSFCNSLIALDKTTELIRLLLLLIIGSILVLRLLVNKILKVGLLLLITPGLIAILYFLYKQLAERA